MADTDKQYRFKGFTAPTYTPVPDELFDELLPLLSGAELKVLLYIIRRTFGFKKNADNIALSQMLNGIVTREGHVLDHGVGLTKKTLLAALASLKNKDIVIAIRRQSAEKGNEPTSYSLNMAGHPLGVISPPRVGGEITPRVGIQITPTPRGKNYTTQETVLQNTVEQETDTLSTSKRKPSRRINDQGSDPSSTQLVPLQELVSEGLGAEVIEVPISNLSVSRLDAAIDEVSDQLGDPSRSSNRSHARRLMTDYGLTEDVMEQFIRRAASRVTDIVAHHGGVKKRGAYYFGVLEDMLKTVPTHRRNLAGRYADRITR